MCGIVGAVGKELNAEWLVNLFVATAPRGKEATGFWTPTTGTIKAPQLANNFFEDKKIMKKFKKGVKESHVLLGHVRYATHGKPEFNYNNHPMESENWVIVHNGVVFIKDFDDYEYQTDTDTENILAYIERYGLVDGLSRIRSGAAVILKDKREENSLYVWKSHSTADLSLFLDEARQVLYVCSGDKYLNHSVKDMWEDIDGFGGLFSKLPITVRSGEPKERELWKCSFAEDKVTCALSETITEHFQAVSGGYWRAGQSPTIEVGYGKLRPGVLEGRVKKPEPRTTHSITPVVLVKHGNLASSIRLFEHDIVELKRDIVMTDAVYCTRGDILTGLVKGKHFEVMKVLRNNRYALADKIGVRYVVEEDLIKPATSPSCLGIAPGANVDKCVDCFFNQACEKMFSEYEKTYVEEEMPECAGAFNYNDEACQKCEVVAYCISHSIFMVDYDVIDAEYKEIEASEYLQG
jgi:hypothetical protein